jgi:hypothetical protein
MKPPKFTTDQLAAIIAAYPEIDKNDLGSLLRADLSVASMGQFRRTVTNSNAHSIVRRHPPPQKSETLGPVGLVQAAFESAKSIKKERSASPPVVEKPKQHEVPPETVSSPKLLTLVPESANKSAQLHEPGWLRRAREIHNGSPSGTLERITTWREQPFAESLDVVLIDRRATKDAETLPFAFVIRPALLARKVILGKGSIIETASVTVAILTLLVVAIHTAEKVLVQDPPDVVTTFQQ